MWGGLATVDVPQLARVAMKVGSRVYTYVAHPDPPSASANRPLRISELGSGFDTLAQPWHPKTKAPLREQALLPGRADRLTVAQLREAMRSALAAVLKHRRPEGYEEEIDRCTRQRLAWEVSNGGNRPCP